MRWHALVGLSVVGALIMAAGASAATVRVAVIGTYTVAPIPTDTNPMPVDVSLAGVAGDLTYAGIGTSTGSLTVAPAAFPFAEATGPGAGLTEFHGDVSQACVRFQGNRAVVIGHLPANEQFDIPFGHMEWVGTNLEDNGVGTAVDRGRAFFMRTSSGVNACNPANPFPAVAQVEPLSAGDASLGYRDQRDDIPSDPDTDVSVVDNANGLSVAISDRLDPGGLEVTVGAGSGFVRFDTCGNKVKVNAGSTAIFTCASLIAEVVAGSAEVELGGGLAVVSIPAGGKVEVADDGSGGFMVENLGQVPVTVTVDGIEATIDPGETSTLQAWGFEGFFNPVDNPPTLNTMKAGAGVPLKWRVLDTSGEPVTDLSAAAITVSELDCETGEGIDQVEQAVTTGSGLQNLGGGYYQLNWKTLKSYAGTCKTMHLDIGDGVTHDAFFDFT